jgi:hypothetical protein
VTDQPHHRLVCQGCRQVIDLDHTYLATCAKAIREDFGFEPIFDHFAIFGWCKECYGGSGQEMRSEDQESESNSQVVGGKGPCTFQMDS